MTYCYVNENIGETKELFHEIVVDEYIFAKGGKCDISFVSGGDTIIMNSLKSIARNLKELLELADYAFKNNIKVKVLNETEENMLDNESAIGKMTLAFLSGLNEFDDKFYGSTENA